MRLRSENEIAICDIPLYARITFVGIPHNVISFIRALNCVLYVLIFITANFFFSFSHLKRYEKALYLYKYRNVEEFILSKDAVKDRLALIFRELFKCFVLQRAFKIRLIRNIRRSSTSRCYFYTHKLAMKVLNNQIRIPICLKSIEYTKARECLYVKLFGVYFTYYIVC